MGKGGKGSGAGGDHLDTEIDMILMTLSEIQDKVGGPKTEKATINPAFKDDEFLVVKDKVRRRKRTEQPRFPPPPPPSL